MAFLQDFTKEAFEWAVACFGTHRATNLEERNLRFLEESLELVQSLGLPKESALAVLEYVYNRPPGTPKQEVGGVLVTLCVLCYSQGIPTEVAALDELERVQKNIEPIRSKNLTKPLFEPQRIRTDWTEKS